MTHYSLRRLPLEADNGMLHISVINKPQIICQHCTFINGLKLLCYTDSGYQENNSTLLYFTTNPYYCLTLSYTLVIFCHMLFDFQARSRIVTTKYGKVQGFVTRVGRDAEQHKHVEIFLGVPYASPPIGSHRQFSIILYSSVYLFQYGNSF